MRGATRLAAGVAAVIVAAALSLPAAPAQTRPLVVGSSATYPPFAFENAQKQIVGFDIDVIQAIARNRGFTVRIVNTPFVGIFVALDNGAIDVVVSGVTINEGRRRSYAFTAPYFESQPLIAVPASSRVRTLQDLAGRKVAVVTGSTADDLASRAFGRTSPNVRRYNSTPRIIAELVAGDVDAVIGDNGVIRYRVREQPTLKTVRDASMPKEYFGIAVSRANQALRDRLDAGLAAIIADGTYAAIYRTWFKTTPPALPTR